jgi:hypothetical protein
MPLLEILIIFSSLFFRLWYSFTTTNMKNDLFDLIKFGTLTAILEIVGAIGLLVYCNAILLISSGGLALLMFLGVGVRLKLKTAC